jgi:molybdopterin/thiamine biosynthesis adenylyltransferase
MSARWERIAPLINLERMQSSAALIVGVGSGGSTVALELAKAGLGRVILCDPDTLAVENVVRHECDERYIGWSKPRAVADLLLHRNALMNVSVIEASIEAVDGGLTELMTGIDLVACCSDSASSRHFVNRHARVSGCPVVYGGVYAGGGGGEVISCPGDRRSACLACVESAVREAASEGSPEPPTYGVDDGREKGVPGLGLDVRFIALIQARACISCLSAAAHDDGAEAVLFANRALDELLPRPLASVRIAVARRQDCLACSSAASKHCRSA